MISLIAANIVIIYAAGCMCYCTFRLAGWIAWSTFVRIRSHIRFRRVQSLSIDCSTTDKQREHRAAGVDEDQIKYFAGFAYRDPDKWMDWHGREEEGGDVGD